MKKHSRKESTWSTKIVHKAPPEAALQAPNPAQCVSITKRFAEFPFAHRQPSHDGHCALIHGHGWTFDLTFACDELEAATGFVVDFGKLKHIRAWLEDKFDHTLVLNFDDPELAIIKRVMPAKVVQVPNCGAEGLAAWILKELNSQFFGERGHVDAQRRNVRLTHVTVWEDSRNSATVAL